MTAENLSFTSNLTATTDHVPTLKELERPTGVLCVSQERILTIPKQALCMLRIKDHMRYTGSTLSIITQNKVQSTDLYHWSDRNTLGHLPKAPPTIRQKDNGFVIAYAQNEFHLRCVDLVQEDRRRGGVPKDFDNGAFVSRTPIERDLCDESYDFTRRLQWGDMMPSSSNFLNSPDPIVDYQIVDNPKKILVTVLSGQQYYLKVETSPSFSQSIVNKCRRFFEK